MKLIPILLIIFMSAAAGADQYYCDNGPDPMHPTMLTITPGGVFKPGKVAYSHASPGEFIWSGHEPEVGTEQVKSDLLTISDLASIPGADYLKGASKKFRVLEATAQGPTYMIMKQKIYVDSAVLSGVRDAGAVIFTNLSQAGRASSRTAEVTYCQLLPAAR